MILDGALEIPAVAHHFFTDLDPVYDDPNIVKQFRHDDYSITVLMPCYNCADSVGRTLDSIDAASKELKQAVCGKRMTVIYVMAFYSL